MQIHSKAETLLKVSPYLLKSNFFFFEGGGGGRGVDKATFTDWITLTFLQCTQTILSLLKKYFNKQIISVVNKI